MNNLSSISTANIKLADAKVVLGFTLLIAGFIKVCREMMTLFRQTWQIRPLYQLHAWQTITIQPYIHNLNLQHTHSHEHSLGYQA